MCLKTCPEIYEMYVCDKKIMDDENIMLKPQKRKKIRRLKKRKFYERTSESQVPLKQRKTKTAAPENTTQFIMADKELAEPFYVIPSPCSSPASHYTSSPESIQGTPSSERDLGFDSTEEDLVREFNHLDFDLDFFHRDFEAMYNRIQEESLLSLSKGELVSKYRELEGKEELLQRQCQELSNGVIFGEHEGSLRDKNSCSTTNTFPARSVKISEEENLLRQLETLQRENRSLAEENLRLKGFKSSSVEINRLS